MADVAIHFLSLFLLSGKNMKFSKEQIIFMPHWESKETNGG